MMKKALFVLGLALTFFLLSSFAVSAYGCYSCGYGNNYGGGWYGGYGGWYGYSNHYSYSPGYYYQSWHYAPSYYYYTPYYYPHRYMDGYGGWGGRYW